MRGEAATIRPYRRSDREAVRAICRITAYRNKGYQLAFEDGQVFADYWSRYYTDFEPESALVAEIGGQIVGYLLGCANTRRHIRIMALRVVPPVAARILWNLLWRRYKSPATFRMLRWVLAKSWREAPEVPLERYPAHYHCNLLPDAIGLKLYTRMVTLFLDRLEASGVMGIHGTIEEPERGGPWRRMVDRIGEKSVFYAEQSTNMPKDVFLDSRRVWKLRIWGDTVERYRLFIDCADRQFNI